MTTSECFIREKLKTKIFAKTKQNIFRLLFKAGQDKRINCLYQEFFPQKEIFSYLTSSRGLAAKAEEDS